MTVERATVTVTGAQLAAPVRAPEFPELSDPDPVPELPEAAAPDEAGRTVMYLVEVEVPLMVVVAEEDPALAMEAAPSDPEFPPAPADLVA